FALPEPAARAAGGARTRRSAAPRAGWRPECLPVLAAFPAIDRGKRAAPGGSRIRVAAHLADLRAAGRHPDRPHPGLRRALRARFPPWPVTRIGLPARDGRPADVRAPAAYAPEPPINPTGLKRHAAGQPHRRYPPGPLARSPRQRRPPAP